MESKGTGVGTETITVNGVEVVVLGEEVSAWLDDNVSVPRWDVVWDSLTFVWDEASGTYSVSYDAFTGDDDYSTAVMTEHVDSLPI